MNWIRFVLCVAVVCGSAMPGIGSARAPGVEARLAHAEGELVHAAHTDPGYRAGAPDPLSVDPDLAIWTLVVFVILLVVLKKFAWGPILEALERREQSVADHITQAERTHEQAKELLADYERKLAGAANQVRELLEEARRDAEHTKQEILVEAKAGAEAERARALRDIEAAADAAMESLARRSSDLAIELAGKILAAQLSKADHARLIQEAMAKFPATASTN
jgi:F-type H+-transporting ATPase subunit b